MLRKILHNLVAQPRVYDAVQHLAGADRVERHIERRLPGRDRIARVLDLGGGTGISRSLWPVDCTYICLDEDMQKLEGFRRKGTLGTPLLADATRIPIRANSLDAVLCKMVSHHLTEAAWAMLIEESARVLKDGGTFIFVDAVLAPRRLVGRLLWSLDRGAHPRQAGILRASISRRFQVRHWERFAIYHEYVLCIATKVGASASGATR